jgi:protein involved in polysaccharide export with SLBB domain
VAVQGDVAHPGLIELAPGMTVTQAVASAGGPLHGTGEYVSIQSVSGKRYKKGWLSLGFMSAQRIPDPVLQPDDVVEVRQGEGKE